LAGVLLLVVGPSGAGKDTLIAGARAALDGKRFVFPRRTISRPAQAGGEDHIAATADDMTRRTARGEFALAWSAHGHDYGIPASISDDLDAGRHVVVNVSRTVIDAARRDFARVGVVVVVAPRDALKERLGKRGREDAAAVDRRLARATAYEVTGDAVVEVVNDATVEEGVARLVAALEALAAR
jgi:phosphonate metabolism protein PhnN/1,5-bisphosphokinase (PRPP-forming)